MSDTSSAPPVSIVGYAVGSGLVAMAVVGSVLHFAVPTVPDVASFGGALLAGAAIGALWARWRRAELRD